MYTSFYFKTIYCFIRTLKINYFKTINANMVKSYWKIISMYLHSMREKNLPHIPSKLKSAWFMWTRHILLDWNFVEMWLYYRCIVATTTNYDEILKNCLVFEHTVYNLGIVHSEKWFSIKYLAWQKSIKMQILIRLFISI